jgi:cysteine desulfurase/selenocysteine lyase
MTSPVLERDGRAEARSGFDPQQVRRDFPILQQVTEGKPLVYLDNAATSQKPQFVIDAINRYYTSQNANIHRGVYRLSEESTALYEGAREKIRGFINAPDAREIIFVRSTTEAINLVAYSFGRSLAAGDEVVISAMEHHSNIVPWQMVCEERRARLRVAPINDAGEIVLEDLGDLINDRTRLVAVAHISNSLGTVNPVRQIVEMAQAFGAAVLVDGAQAAPHIKVDVQDLGCDFYTVSGHKMFGPTGIGALYGKADRLEAMPPYQGGGDMIRSVAFHKTEYAPIPAKFEAGTPHIAGAVGLGAAVDYLEALDWDGVERHERDLLAYAIEGLTSVPGVNLIGTAAHKASVISFTLDEVHAHDVGTIVDQEGVAIRTGHHCAQPVMDFYGVPATARASMAFYNTRSDVDALVGALHRAREVFG